MKKMIFVLLVILVFIIYYNSKSKDTKNITDKSIDKSLSLYQYAGNSKLITEGNDLINDYKKLSHSEEKLAGNITNQFGIRDDIFEYVTKNGSQNPKIFKASIKLSQNLQQLYYGNITKESAVSIADNTSLLITCLSSYTNNYIIVNTINSMMRNTSARNAHMWEMDNKLLSWKVIGSGLSIADENIACKNGDF